VLLIPDDRITKEPAVTGEAIKKFMQEFGDVDTVERPLKGPGAWVVDFFVSTDAQKVVKRHFGITIEAVRYWPFRVTLREQLFMENPSFTVFRGSFPPHYDAPPYNSPPPEMIPEWYTKLMALDKRMKTK
jgi:hypothetical protein